MTPLRERLMKIGVPLLLAGGAAVLAHALWTSWNDIHTYGGVDLRDKVVFARLLRAGTDPYFAKMTADWPEELIDPNYYLGAVRISITPPAICVYMPLSGLAYGTQRSAWFCIEWAAFLTSAALLAWSLRPRRGRVLFLLVALYLFAGGYFWRLHVERGQYYAVVLLLLSLASFLFQKKRGAWTAGIPLGIAIAIRPTLIAVPLFLWILRRRETALATLVSLVLFVAACLPFTGLKSWANYAHAVKLWEIQYTYPQALPPRETAPLPTQVEGCDFHEFLPARTTNTSVMDRLSKYQDLVPWIDYRPWLPAFCKGLAAAMTAALAWRLLSLQRGPRYPLYTLGLGAVVACNLDYLLAPMRAGYVDVLLLFPLALLLPLMLRGRLGHGSLAVALAGLLLGHALNNDLGTYYRSFFVMLSLNAVLLVAFLRIRRNPSA